jgi:hypothetical protein
MRSARITGLERVTRLRDLEVGAERMHDVEMRGENDGWPSPGSLSQTSHVSDRIGRNHKASAFHFPANERAALLFMLGFSLDTRNPDPFFDLPGEVAVEEGNGTSDLRPGRDGWLKARSRSGLPCGGAGDRGQCQRDLACRARDARSARWCLIPAGRDNREGLSHEHSLYGRRRWRNSTWHGESSCNRDRATVVDAIRGMAAAAANSGTVAGQRTRDPTTTSGIQCRDRAPRYGRQWRDHER